MNKKVLLSALLCAVPALFAQSQGVFQGVVSDNTGAVIPGAAITVLNQATGVQNQTQTNAVGFYQVPGLSPGLYSMTAASDGFAPQERPQLRLEVGQTARVDFSLNLGSVTEVIEVSAVAQLLQSEKTEVGQVIDSKRILEMPLNGRNYLELAKFSVGVLPSALARQGYASRRRARRRGRRPRGRHARRADQRPARRRR